MSSADNHICLGLSGSSIDYQKTSSFPAIDNVFGLSRYDEQPYRVRLRTVVCLCLLSASDETVKQHHVQGPQPASHQDCYH